MKKLNFEQMENLNGGFDQRNCMMLGVGLVASIPLAIFKPIAWGFTGGAFLTSAGGGCF